MYLAPIVMREDHTEKLNETQSTHGIGCGGIVFVKNRNQVGGSIFILFASTAKEDHMPDTQKHAEAAVAGLDERLGCQLPPMAAEIIQRHIDAAVEEVELRRDLENADEYIRDKGHRLEDGEWDSCCHSDAVNGMLLLEKHGKFKISSQTGRRIFGRFVEDDHA